MFEQSEPQNKNAGITHNTRAP